MTDFELRLQRLKECLGVSEDQEVAQALGMTKASLSDRKRRGSFPERQVVGLKSRFPGLDVQYVLFGGPIEGVSGTEMNAFLDASHALGLDPTAVSQAIGQGFAKGVDERLSALDHPLVLSLVETLHWCDDEAIELLIRVAARFRGAAKDSLGSRAAAASRRSTSGYGHADVAKLTSHLRTGPDPNEAAHQIKGKRRAGPIAVSGSSSAGQPKPSSRQKPARK